MPGGASPPLPRPPPHRSMWTAQASAGLGRARQPFRGVAVGPSMTNAPAVPGSPSSEDFFRAQETPLTKRQVTEPDRTNADPLEPGDT